MIPFANLAAPAVLLALVAADAAIDRGPTPPDNRALTLKVGEKRVLLLPGNPTTGYAWSLAEPLPVHAPVAVELSLEAPGAQGKTPLCGAPRGTLATLEGLRKGSCTVVLAYARPWEKDRPAAQTRTLAVTVE